MKAGHDGTLEEAFGTGTAAVISPVGEFVYKDDKVTVNDFKTGELTQKLYDYLTGIQWAAWKTNITGPWKSADQSSYPGDMGGLMSPFFEQNKMQAGGFPLYGNQEGNMERQDRAPLVDALKRYQKERPAYFCIPGHRYERGLGQRWLTEAECGFLKYDLTEVSGLDDLHRPQGIIREAQELLADLYGAKKSYFLVNGTTCGNEAMLLGALKENDEIILPRNVHKSVLQGLILCGARPVYLMPKWIEKAGIWGGISPREVENALEHHPGAKAVFLVSPSYYGICCDVKQIADICHRFGVPLLVDEAHGSHLYFSSLLPRARCSRGRMDVPRVSTRRREH